MFVENGRSGIGSRCKIRKKERERESIIGNTRMTKYMRL